MYDITAIRKLLLSRPKKTIGFFPTPLHKLDRLSEELGVNLYIKRDDMTGVSLFGGNKVRKLEYLLGDAMAQGCDTIFTFGATQSNHAMQTATACCKYGLKPILYLLAYVDPSDDDLRSNLLLNKIMGTEIHVISMKDKTEEEASALSLKLSDERRRELEAIGHKCYIIPGGGASPVGSSGFAAGFVEMDQQMKEIGQHADYIFHSTGTGGTLAGLAAGKKLMDSDTSIIAITVSQKSGEYGKNTAKLAMDTLAYLGSDKTVSEEDFYIDSNYYQPGYEIPNEGSTNAIQLLARKEGIFLDPVYTGKGFAGMLDYIRTGKVPQGSTIVFWHTGGGTALFAEKDMVGDVTKQNS
ncbi:MAG TPA: D-cysteine desulfhydrase family protein [Clostridiales bacterium]|nr:D-cysteine desulfhydrase family protein [Clostridiales bacterium]